MAFLFLGLSTRAQESLVLKAQDFKDQFLKDSQAVLVDVRTPAEYEKGHITGAININYFAPDFEGKIQILDKEKPIYLYCQSGNRSGKAAAKLKDLGFKHIRDLGGGMIQWRANYLPEEKSTETAPSGLTVEDFKNMLNSDKMVLVDYYADWCAPCKLMEPYLKDIEQELKDKVKLIRIDADKNQKLFTALNIGGVPALQIYKNNRLTWMQNGFVQKSVIVEQLQ